MTLHVAYRLRVVVSLFIVTTLFFSIISAQTPRRAGKRPTAARSTAAGTTRDGTLIICQGVPVPNGYAIIAYLTSTACPHGAYVLKKQDAYSESLASRYANQQQQSATAAAVDDAVTTNSTSSNRYQPIQPVVTPVITLGVGGSTAAPLTPLGNAGGTQPAGSLSQLSRSSVSIQPPPTQADPQLALSQPAIDPGSRPR